MTTATDQTWEVVPSPSSPRIKTSTEGEQATCAACYQEITLLGGSWTDPDGCTNCYGDLSAPYVPHKPTEGEHPIPLAKPADPFFGIPNADDEQNEPW
jgi:hypothetical protein